MPMCFAGCSNRARNHHIYQKHLSGKTSIGRRAATALQPCVRPVGPIVSCAYSSTSALWPVFHARVTIACTFVHARRSLPFCSGNPGAGGMTMNHETDYQAELGKRLFGTAVVAFGHGLAWLDSPGIFTFLPNDKHRLSNMFCRAEIILGLFLAAYGMLAWRSVFRDLSPANYILAFSSALVLLPCTSKITEWAYFLLQQRGFSMNALRVGLVQITVPVCVAVLGAWWADRTFMLARFQRLLFRRFVE
jgi:hypothetical protein